MRQKEGPVTRRTFLSTSVAATLGGLAAAAPSRALGANDRIRVGFIGVGNRGSQLLEIFMKQPDVEVAALCDVYEPYLSRDRSRVSKRFLDQVGERVPAMGEALPATVGRHHDFRELIARKDVDAVCIATPDHWHALQTIAACQAGKDVYVEKPLTYTIREGRLMAEAAARAQRVVQVGLNRRGSKTYRELVDLVRGGRIGRPTAARCFRISNMSPDGIGVERPSDPPPGLDWDTWVGPRPFQPFQDNIAPYKFRWWRSYSSQVANWAVHYLDAIRWLVGETAPIAASAHGTKVLKDDRTIPDTLEATWEFASGFLATFGLYEASDGPGVAWGELEIRGTEATLFADENGYRIVPRSGGQFQKREPKAEAVEKRLAQREDATVHLVRNFLDCVRSRQKPWCDLEEGHRSTLFAHLANIAIDRKARIEWDGERERITSSSESDALLHYTYRAPWKLS
jgi:predicted dehydrogenase